MHQHFTKKSIMISVNLGGKTKLDSVSFFKGKTEV